MTHVLFVVSVNIIILGAITSFSTRMNSLNAQQLLITLQLIILQYAEICIYVSIRVFTLFRVLWEQYEGWYPAPTEAQ